MLGSCMSQGSPFMDDRGTIEDLLVEPIDSVTRIFTKRGAVRGNHYHLQTTQWTYVLTGCLKVVGAYEKRTLGPGDLYKDEPGTPHAWKAVMDTDCLVFTRGPRSGDQYESDTYRLDEPLLAA